ncbi:MAG TPA: LON peptidase substrate-binding domain-containing protein, partial [Caldilineaceae bacterium]|nr:LON peptidase substrate-binding domain-containing protein [Caldilineaceae bacterium]
MTVENERDETEESAVEESAPKPKKSGPKSGSRSRKRKKRDDSGISDDLPLLPLRGVVVYPMMWLPLTIGQERSINLVEDALPESRIIALVTSRDEAVDEPSPDDIYSIGTAAQVHRVLKAPDGTIRLAVQGLERIRITEYIQEDPYLRARVEVLPETITENLETEALTRAVQDLFRRLVELDGQMPEELAVMAANVLVVAYAFMINDIEDAPDDAMDPARAKRNPVTSGLISVRAGYTACRIVAAATMLLYAFGGAWVFIIGGITLLLSHLYSWKPVRLKAWA